MKDSTREGRGGGGQVDDHCEKTVVRNIKDSIFFSVKLRVNLRCKHSKHVSKVGCIVQRIQFIEIIGKHFLY